MTMEDHGICYCTHAMESHDQNIGGFLNGCSQCDCVDYDPHPFNEPCNCAGVTK